MSAEHFRETLNLKCICPRWCYPYAVTFYIVKQRLRLNSSIINQLMEFIQVGMIMHVSVPVSGMDLLSPIQVKLTERIS